MCENERTRLVVLGGPAVGKTAIVKRFLYSTFTEKYRSTVEDLHSRQFDLGPITIKVFNFYNVVFLNELSYFMYEFMFFILISYQIVLLLRVKLVLFLFNTSSFSYIRVNWLNVQ